MSILLVLISLILPTSLWAAPRFEELHKISDSVWGLDFLADGRVIFTAREGKMSVLDLKTKKTTDVTGLPKIYVAGQGGLLDVRVGPDQFIYFTYSEPHKAGSTTALMKAKLDGNKLTENKLLFSGKSPNDNDIHFGSRIEFDDKGHVFFTMGDRNDRDKAQVLNYHMGKVLRLKLDGSTPSDNPFVGKKDALPEIWSLGHRSPQGLVRHPVTGDLWEAEMGPRGGDEINLIKAGANYGWPKATYGKEYWGPSIGDNKVNGTVQPQVYWVPSISPSAITFYTGDKYPQWKHSLFVATLSGEHVRRLTLDGERITGQEELLAKMGRRWRVVRTGPDGELYLASDEGHIGRLLP
jgi:glucose/arabinose dehydrogenase